MEADFDALLDETANGKPGTRSRVDRILEELDPDNRAKVLAALNSPVDAVGNTRLATALSRLINQPVNEQHISRWRKANCG